MHNTKKHRSLDESIILLTNVLSTVCVCVSASMCVCVYTKQQRQNKRKQKIPELLGTHLQKLQHSKVEYIIEAREDFCPTDHIRQLAPESRVEPGLSVRQTC